MTKKITESERMQLIGLLLLANKLGVQETLLENAAADILQIGDRSEEAYERGGWLIIDNMYGCVDIENTVDKFLKDNKIKIEK